MKVTGKTVFSLWLTLVLTACNSRSISSKAEPAKAMVTEAATAIVSTSNLTPTSTLTQGSRTPLPTLPAEVVDNRVIELLKTNAGCSLPCWWAITPGSTSLEEVQSILEPFLGAVMSDVRYEFAPTGGHLLMRPQPNGLRVGIQYLAKDKIVSMIYINTEMTEDTYNRVYDDPFYREVMSVYTLDAMLAKYGKPDQILVRSFSDLASEFNPTQILLYYPNKGIVAQYFSKNELEQQNGTLVNQVCPLVSHISLRLFNPDSPMSLDQLLALDDSYSQYKEISEVSKLNADAFFTIYKQSNENTGTSDCPAYFTTAWDLWPNEYHNP